MPPGRRLRRRVEFQAVQRSGRRCSSSNFIVFWQQRSNTSRLGITVSRRVGSAVIRNRLKRRVREVYRRLLRPTIAGDVVVIARPGAGELGFSELTADLNALFGRVVEHGQDRIRR